MCVITLHPVCSLAAAAEARGEPAISQRAITTDSRARALQRDVISCFNVFFTCLRLGAFPDNLNTTNKPLLGKCLA